MILLQSRWITHAFKRAVRLNGQHFKAVTAF
jgi:hypothetical protein